MRDVGAVTAIDMGTPAEEQAPGPGSRPDKAALRSLEAPHGSILFLMACILPGAGIAAEQLCFRIMLEGKTLVADPFFPSRIHLLACVAASVACAFGYFATRARRFCTGAAPGGLRLATFGHGLAHGPRFWPGHLCRTSCCSTAPPRWRWPRTGA